MCFDEWLPEREFHEKAMNFVIEFAKNKIDAEVEYLQLFTYLTGDLQGNEVEGSEYHASENFENVRLDHLALIHNHTTFNSSKPSFTDIKEVLTKDMDYSIITTKNETWFLRCPEKYENIGLESLENDYNQYLVECCTVVANYAYEKGLISDDELGEIKHNKDSKTSKRIIDKFTNDFDEMINNCFNNIIEEFINQMEYNIRVFRRGPNNK
nr:hypothetical protein [Methanobrevibacter arboriphilus]